MRKSLFGLLGLCLAISISACNFFSPVDKPSGDQQLISAARACLDQGNFQCAINNYQALSPGSVDVATSEGAFAVFDQAGATMQNFAAGFGDGKSVVIGQSLSIMAGGMVQSVGAANRIAVFNAFQTYKNIQDNTRLAQLVRFIGASAMMGLVLAEDIPSGSTTYTKADVSSGIIPGGANMSQGTGNMTTAAVADFSASQASLNMFNAAAIDMVAAASAIGGSSSLAVGSGQLATLAVANGPVGAAAAYRTLMIGSPFFFGL